MSFTRNLCLPLARASYNNLVGGNEEDEKGSNNLLRAGDNQVRRRDNQVRVWLELVHCDGTNCSSSNGGRVRFKREMKDFFLSHSSQVRVRCEEWGVEGVHMVRVSDGGGGEIARSREFSVVWSKEYSLVVNSPPAATCQQGMVTHTV